MNDVLEALKALIVIFERMKLGYAVIGGLAVRAYGIPRPTFDVDFTLALSREGLSELYAAIEEHGHSVLESYRAGWVDEVAGMPLVKLRTYIQGHGVDVDIFLAETPFQLEILRRRKLAETIDGDLWLASPEDIILLKLMAYRTKDQNDVQDVLFAQGQLDEVYLRHWAEELSVTTRLNEVLEKNRDMF